MKTEGELPRFLPEIPPRGRLWKIRRSVRFGIVDVWARWRRWRRGAQPFANFDGIIWINLHHVTRREESVFGSFLDWLQANFQLLGYGQAVEQLIGGQGQGPRLAISFDDGLENHLAAARILAERGLSACFFICPGIIGKPVGNETARFCVERLLIAPTSFLNWEQVEQIKNWGHELGAHTQDHLNLARISSSQMIDQLGRSRDVLHQRLGAVDHFAWTYGQFSDFSGEAFRQVFSMGFRSCASGVRGSHQTRRAQSADQICLRREQTEMSWPLHHAEFFLERSSWRPLAAEQTVPKVWQEQSSTGNECG